MQSTNVAIVGLGKIGSFFLQQLISRFNLGLNIIRAVEPNDTEGKELAQKNGIAVVTIDDLISFEDDVHIIFNLTGLDSVQQEIRHKLDASCNFKTELLSDNVLKVVWSMLTDEPIPER